MTDPSPQPVFVLVRPQMGENIGAAARAMANFGLGRMRIVAPRDGWPNPKADAMASGAGRVLDDAMIYDTTIQAIADCNHVYATTARGRDLTKTILDPEAAMTQTAGQIRAGARVAILFGPERTGLENDDIARANAIISVPVSPDYPSLNLAQCALLTAYEWRRQMLSGNIVDKAAQPRIATALEVEKLGDHFEERLDAAGFFFPETKSASMRLSLRNMWSRLPLNDADVRMLHGALRQMVRWKERG